MTTSLEILKTIKLIKIVNTFWAYIPVQKLCPGFEIGPIRVSETCQNSSGQVKCRYMVIRRTCQFCYGNLKLGLLKSQRQFGTSHADTDEDDVSLAGALQLQLVAQYVAWSTFLGDNTRFLVSGRRRVSNLQASPGSFLPQQS